MNNKSINLFFNNIEIYIVGLLLLIAEATWIPLLNSSFVNILTYALVIFLILRRLPRFAYVATRDMSLLIFVGLAVISILWSVSPSDTFMHIRAALRSTLFGIYLSTQYTPREILRLLCWVTAIAAILSIIACLSLPSLAIDSTITSTGAWQGIFAHKQNLGRFMSFTASIFLVLLLDKSHRRFINIAGLILAVALIILSQSKTALISLVLLISLLPLYKVIQQKKARAFSLLIALLVGSSIATLLAVNLETIVVDILGKNLELNGRTPIWELSILQGIQRPFWGYGYNAFWTSSYGNQVIMNTWAGLDEKFASGEIIFHAHNGFLDIFLQLGMIGFCVFILHFFSVVMRIIKLIVLTRKIEYFWMLIFLEFYFVANMAEGLIILPTNGIYWVIYISIVLSSAVELKRIEFMQKSIALSF
ncbi:O-antigen ligase family protein [Calothrix sp. 336/3]|uniref:O-antigen ligase family protein n=1 Tax=Calothrix sp. 336/3 TaxID=1337936 RepID=UPI0005558D26|nr:O-antigen ligase family protein [Calothrix sp. 336/3]AKG21133.1 hypothetical protein IJ00_07310 [Calothrix sp. 336/3]